MKGASMIKWESLHSDPGQNHMPFKLGVSMKMLALSLFFLFPNKDRQLIFEGVSSGHRWIGMSGDGYPQLRVSPYKWASLSCFLDIVTHKTTGQGPVWTMAEQAQVLGFTIIIPLRPTLNRFSHNWKRSHHKFLCR